MNQLIKVESPSFRLILPEHGEFFTLDVLEAYRFVTVTEKNLFHKAIPAVNQVLEMYQLYADVKDTKEGVKEYYRRRNEDETISELLESITEQELFWTYLNAYGDGDEITEFLYLDMVDVFEYYHVCYAEVLGEEHPGGINVFYRNMPIRQVW